MKMIKLGVHGANGKVGKKLVEYLESLDEKNLALSYPYIRSGPTSSFDKLMKNSDIIIDFSSPEGLSNIVSLCVEYNKPLVSGTTGIDDDIRARIQEAAETIPIFYAPNVSIGANLIGIIASTTVKHLSKEYDVEILDIHHKTKKDAPSGTAIQIEKMIKAAETEHEVHITSIRTGSNPGEYHILFSGMDETVTISHKVTSKMPYVIGACRAAEWISSKKPGLYGMIDLMSQEK